MLRLKEIRTSKGKTQLEIAEYLNIARASYANIENGKRDPDTQTLILLADYFGLTIDEICGREPDPENKEKPTADTDDGLKKEIIGLIGQLPEDDLLQIRDYAAWLKSRHAK